MTNVAEMPKVQEVENRKFVEQMVRLLWSASCSLPEGKHPVTSLTNRCVYASLALIDLLAEAGVAASPVVCGLEVYRPAQLALGEGPRRVWIGHPRCEVARGRLNAHVVVRVGNLLVDPTLLQANRPWNDLETYMILPFLSEAERASNRMQHGAKLDQPVLARAEVKGDVRVTYFELTDKVARHAKTWRQSGDAKPDRRRVLVKHSIDVMAELIKLDRFVGLSNGLPTVSGALLERPIMRSEVEQSENIQIRQLTDRKVA